MTDPAELTVTRWRKYGKDRLYVNDSAGVRVGWVDLLNGDRHLEQQHLAAVFATSVAAHWPVDRPAATTEAVDAAAAPAPEDVLVVEGYRVAWSAEDNEYVATCADFPSLSWLAGTEGAALAGLRRLVADTEQELAQQESPESQEPWEDLALRRPGQAAREKALEELAASRERSRFWSFVARAVDAKTDERAWRVGADGEESVGGRLEKLHTRGWYVLHAVPVGERGSDIDHVLLGPGGVYTINTKNHPGGKVWVGKNSVRVNGHVVPYLRNSRHEAQRAARLLSASAGFDVPVRPVLVFLTGTIIPDVTIKTAPEDVLILDRMDIPGAFKRAPLRMDTRVVELIYEVARRSTTWSPAR